MSEKGNKLVTVKTFVFSHEIGIAQSLLESEGIYCFVQDELTSQVHPFISTAIGGVKLQVMEDDVERAVRILKDGGFLQEEDLQPTKFETKLYRFFSKIPWLRNIYK